MPSSPCPRKKHFAKVFSIFILFSLVVSSPSFAIDQGRHELLQKKSNGVSTQGLGHLTHLLKRDDWAGARSEEVKIHFPECRKMELTQLLAVPSCASSCRPMCICPLLLSRRGGRSLLISAALLLQAAPCQACGFYNTDTMARLVIQYDWYCCKRLLLHQS